MQRYNVSHRDIKPQNILIINGIYKICDFGEARVIDGNGLVIQHVRGSQLYMSPILFYAYNHNVSQVLHNTYKSDVFSLGMCILLAATLSGYTLYDIREIIDINTITKIIFNTLNGRYSKNFINLIIKMLQIDENLRMDFIELEKFISNIFKK
jgi:serine/threonine protein kinase